ncbi:MAG: hypothetical protein GY854_33580 [Deltaproteobacteria bacterium]|nr:hypothetical protein [Deltaproteobacteria bacterium]
MRHVYTSSVIQFIQARRFVRTCFAIFSLLVIASAAHAEGDGTTTNADDEHRNAFQRGLGTEDESSRALNLKIERFGHSLLLRGVLANGESAKDLKCLLCSTSESLTKARTLGAVISAERDSRKPASVIVPIAYKKDRVLLDGIPVAPPEASHPVEPGEHVVEFHREEGVAKATLNLAPGEEINLEAPATFRKKKSQLRTGLLLAGLGITAAAIGGVFLWLDGNCGSTAANTDGSCSRSHELTITGWSLVGAGVAIEISTLIWLLLPDDDSLPSTEKK